MHYLPGPAGTGTYHFPALRSGILDCTACPIGLLCVSKLWDATEAPSTPSYCPIFKIKAHLGLQLKA